MSTIYRSFSSSLRSDRLFGRGGMREFSDPFLLPSNESMPIEFRSALDYCAFLYGLNPIYQKAAARVYSHFITDIEFPNARGDKREQELIREYLIEHLKIKGSMMELGDDWSAYGNAFMRIHFPFVRTLVDRRSGFRREYSLDTWADIPDGIRYDYTTMTYSVYDPRDMETKPRGKWGRINLTPLDRESSDWTKIKLVRIWPQQVQLSHATMPNTNRVVWEIDNDLIRDVRNSVLYQVNNTPLEILQAIKENKNYEFKENEVFHMKAPRISGITNGGWGVPEVLLNYRNIHQLQVYRKIDEAIGLDYVVPFRVVTPGVDVGDMASQATRTALRAWRHHAQSMVRQHRESPFGIYAMPLPVKMESFSHGDMTMVTKDQIGWHTDHLLDGMGFPAELFHGTLNIMQVPQAVRMFENAFHFIGDGYNSYLKWVVSQIRTFLGLEPMKVRMQQPRVADNIELRALFMQMMAAGELPRSEGWKDILNGRDPVDLIRARKIEDLEAQRVSMEEETRFQREQTQGSLSDRVQAEQAGSMGGAPGGGEGATPLKVMDDARAKAQEMLDIPYVGERRKALQALEMEDPQMYALVKTEMEKRRREGESSGRQMVQGGGPPA